MVDGDDEAGDMREGDDNGTVVVDTLDGALDTSKAAGDETDLTALLTEEIGIGDAGAATGGVVSLHGTHEIEHLALGDGDDNRGLVGSAGLDSHILQGLTATVEHLQLANLGAIAVEEDEVVDGRLVALDNLLTNTHDDMLHGEEIFDTGLVEGLLDIELAGISDVHGEPGERCLMDDV